MSRLTCVFGSLSEPNIGYVWGVDGGNERSALLVETPLAYSTRAALARQSTALPSNNTPVTTSSPYTTCRKRCSFRR